MPDRPPPPISCSGVGPAAGRKPFAVQAAMFSLYAVPAAMVVGLFARIAPASANDPVRWVVLAVVAAGFVLGVWALVAMRWTGRRGVLVRAVVGLLLNGSILAAVGAADLGMFNARGLDPKVLVGRWTRRVPTRIANLEDTLSLAADGTCRETFRLPTSTVVDDWSGTWELDGRRRLVVAVARVDAGAAAAHQSGTYAFVRGIVDGDLVLLMGQDQVYFHPAR